MTITELGLHFRYPDAPGGHQRAYFLPGETLVGVVLLENDTPLRVEGIFVSVVGGANVAWEADHRDKTYHAKENHLDVGTSVVPQYMTSPSTLRAGKHKFKFTIALPLDIPSSFNGVYGGVYYVAKATVSCTNERLSSETCEPFMVLRRPPLSPAVCEPVTMHKSRFFVGIKSGKIKITVSLDTQAASPGHTLLVDADVCNWSGKHISLLQAAILQESHYFAEGKRIVFRQYLNNRDDHFDTNNRTGRRWHRVKMVVPPYLADSGLYKCGIIDVQYKFQFRVQIDKADDLVVETPLYVGAAPSTSSAPSHNDDTSVWPWASATPTTKATPFATHRQSDPWLLTGSWHRGVFPAPGHNGRI